MGNKPVKLKVFIDKEKKKVMFAEAEEDFVDILFSFLTLPLGTITRLLNHSNKIKLGSMTSLYESVMKLDSMHFFNRSCKNVLVYPKSSSDDLCNKMKLNLNVQFYTLGKLSSRSEHVDGYTVLVKKKGSFIIGDDLSVTPFLIERHVQLQNTYGAEYIDLVEKTIYFGSLEFTNLLKWSLCTNNPLTNLVYRAQSKPCFYPCSLSIKNPTISSKPSPKPQTVLLLVQKSKKKVLCAQVDNFFVDMLFCFLITPLGAVKRLTNDTNSSSVGLDNLCNSISSLVKSNDVKTRLLDPKVASIYLRATDYLPIYNKDAKSTKTYLREQASFLVSDDLKITISSICNTSKFTCGVPVDDVEAVQVSIGEREALLILKASLISSSVLTDFFNTCL